ncbi:MAG: UDP-N-acetylmuramoyl-tripeptide--D-alanyl-D-alanine ligase [Cyanobacteria bacterium P01_E01_bin.34]
MTCHGPLAELTRQLNATPYGQSEALARVEAGTFYGICTDTRKLTPGCIFIALGGERFDGHDYVQQALTQGAIAAVVTRPVSSVEGLQLVVNDTLDAYQASARWWRSQFDIPVLAITGSAGKTSTKEMLAAALSCYGKVLKTEKNYNNDIGVPLTLLQLDASHRFVVLELAMRGPGEIARLTRMAVPTHGIIVNIGTAHIGRLGSKAAIARAKCELLEHLNPDSGTAILNGEDKLLLKTATEVWQGTTRKFGFSGADLTADWHPQPPRITWQENLLPVPLKGRHQGLNYAAVIEAISSLGLDVSALESGIELPVEASGRNRRYRLPDGIELLDESYNAAPEAVIAALQLLCEEDSSSGSGGSKNRQCWAVLGPMRELGDAADGLYVDVGRVAASLISHGLHICLFDPDAEMAGLVQEIPPTRIHCFSEREPLAEWLCLAVQKNDRILFKAARSIAIETVMHRFIQCRYPDWQLSIQD